jgi:AcrR family transcriptional regulator
MGSHVNSIVEDPELIAKRRAQLVEAAIKLFSRVGYHPATVKEIANAAGVSAGLLYQYASSKQDLLFLCLLHIVERNKDEIPKALERVTDPLSRLAASVEAYTRVIAANREAVQLTYRETKSLKREYVMVMKQMELETNALIAGCVEECVKSGYLKATHTELLVYRIIVGAHAWALKYWRLSLITSLDEYIEQSIHSCWRVLLTAKGQRRLGQMQNSCAADMR